MTAADQEINGDMVVDEVSELNLYLKDNSTFTGAVNSAGARPGQRVLIESQSRTILGAALLVYLLPLGAFLSGYLLAALCGAEESARFLSIGRHGGTEEIFRCPNRPCCLLPGTVPLSAG